MGERPVNQRPGILGTLVFDYQWAPKPTPDVVAAPDGTTHKHRRDWTRSRNAGRAGRALTRRRRRNAIAVASYRMRILRRPDPRVRHPDRPMIGRKQVSTEAAWALALHGAVCVALRHPAVRAGDTGTARARLALWRDLLGEVLVTMGGLTLAELTAAHVGLEDCAAREPIPTWRFPLPDADTAACRCWLAPGHLRDHHCPGDKHGHRMPAHGAHTWRS